MGKTALGTNMAVNAARAGKRVLFVTLEMSKKQLVLRMATHMAEVSYENLSEGMLDDDEMQRVAHALGELSELPITISESVRTPGQLYSYAMRQMAMGGVDIIFVDYIQLMSPDKAYSSRVLEVGALSRALASMSLDEDGLGVPIVALVQLSRSVEKRENRRPILVDLRDSGELEQDAAIVMFMYRDEYYYREEDDDGDGEDYIPGECEIIVAKNRFGKSNVTCRLHFEPETGKFSKYNPVLIPLPGPA
jgi:replicative DNA helicase